MTNPPAPHFNNPEHWHQRAEEARVQAEQMTTPDCREQMLRCADDYDRIAVRAAVRLHDGL